jgi:outer membrane protein
MRIQHTVSAVLLLALAPLARAETRIGVVDTQKAVMGSDEGKAVSASLKKEQDEKQKQLDAKQQEFAKLRDDFEKQAAVLSDQAKKDKATELDKRAGELQQMYFQLQQELAQKEQEATKGIGDRMMAIVREIADANGIQLVVTKGAAIYTADSLDLTNEVIRKYNAKFPYKGGAAAGTGGTKPPGGAKPPGAGGTKPPAAGGK